MSAFHQPVLLTEIIDYLNIKKSGKYIDATVGGGSHSAAICKLGGHILGIDLDPEAIEAARRHLLQACPFPDQKSGNDAPWRLAEGNFADIGRLARSNGFSRVNGVLFDLGVSSHQLTSPSRGFSFRARGPLDMRMSPKLGVTAADLLNALSQKELYELFFKLGEDPYSRRLASLVVRARRVKPFSQTSDLTDLLPVRRTARLHPATRIFQALRIAVNDELNNLRQALPAAADLLIPGGRLAVISFHSGEDRIVKNYFVSGEAAGKLKIITDKPVRPSAAEISRNPRSRSAKLRVAEKGKKHEKNR